MSNETTDLELGFEDPNQEARPYVWYHFLGSNISEGGIEKDLEWMNDIGIGGIQQFNVDAFTPNYTGEPVRYMDENYQSAIDLLGDLTEEYNMEFGVASSPGWSETGGPWVEAKDGMKKVVWSETYVSGGEKFDGQLDAPPSTTGAYQDVDIEPILLSFDEGLEYYEDIQVLAVRVDDNPAGRPSDVGINGGTVDASAMSDASMVSSVTVDRGTAENPVVVTFTYDEPTTVQSLSAYFYEERTGSSATTLSPVLEVKTQSGWEKVTDIPVEIHQSTLSFEPVTGTEFRVVFNTPGSKGNPVNPNPQPSDSQLNISQLQLNSNPQVDHAEAKAAYETVPDYQEISDGVPNSEGVPVDEVIDLTDQMDEEGNLTWTPPDDGNWKIIRMGYSLTGSNNSPASPEATGLEVDKYDGDAVRNYIETYLDMHDEATGEDGGLDALLTDSIEAGPSNWTPEFKERFIDLHGYDPTPYMASFTGTVIGSSEETDQFLHDYRATLGDLIATEHYGTIADVAEERDFVYYSEAIERIRTVQGDDMKMRSEADVPMAALWTYKPEEGPEPRLVGDMKGASSTANLYGQNLVALESLTSPDNAWGYAPSDLRPMIDMAYASGINRTIIHTSPHQPTEDEPGASLAGFGQMFSRHDTWADQAGAWTDYMARSNYLLQQGNTVSDIGYFFGEDTPVAELYADGAPEDAPTEYYFDYVNPDALLNHLSVDEDGAVISTGGARYELLYLGGTSEYMTLEVLKKLEDLVESGATIVGNPPIKSPSLGDDTEEYQEIVDKLWSGETVTEVGEGRVIVSDDPEAVLADQGLEPGFSDADSDIDSDLHFIQRELDNDGDLFFITNQGLDDVSMEAKFRVTGKTAEFYHADTGLIEAASFRDDGEYTYVPLELAAQDSVFVVFNEDAAASSAKAADLTLTEIGEIEGTWTVVFEEDKGAPERIELTELTSLSEHSDDGVKYFSGVASYTTTFTLPEGTEPGEEVWVEFEDVAKIADVRVNGELVETVWFEPYRANISDALVQGENTITIDVANTWKNRLIGDAVGDAGSVDPFNPDMSDNVASTPTYGFGQPYQANEPLDESGLIGTVTLFTQAGSATGSDGSEALSGSDSGDTLDARGGDDVVRGGGGHDTITLGSGDDVLKGTAGELDGDIITDFSFDDLIVFEEASFARSDFRVDEADNGSVSIDSDGDGNSDADLTFQNLNDNGDFMVVAFGGETDVQFVDFLPDLADGQEIDADQVNGVVNQNFLRGDGDTDFLLEMRDLGFAGYDNSIGVYEISEDGTIVDTRVLVTNANASLDDQILIEDVGAGNTLGFFIIQDAAEWTESLADGDVFEFRTQEGNVASADDDEALFLYVNGTNSGQNVFHSYSSDLNFDGVEHALSGVDAGGDSMTIGFEDLTGGGDRDYEDVGFSVTRVDVDEFMFV